MIRRPPKFTRTDTLFPYTTLFRSTIISHARLGWPGAVLGLAAAAMVVAVARVKAAAFQQSIRKARETEERARTAQAVLRSFEESGSHLLWETDTSEEHRVGTACVRQCRIRR